MIIYKCLISNDEMFTDAYKMTETKDGMFYKVEGKIITRKKDDIDGKLLGANPSAEEETVVVDESSVSGPDIVLNHNLVAMNFNKKNLKIQMKNNVKAIKAHLEETNPEKVEKFMADMLAAFATILENFEEYTFYLGETMSTDGMVALLGYDDSTPYMLFFKDCLVIEKY
ncbi:translationally-controlled tumor protein homolog isoform X2 [Chaetodon trifascialis]|uniref:translationally-controlled tumor protein homolog isoform X2 n=1 Tax=Chaetodon trifascialis TaxID=109706 RepID=UPI003996BB9B